MPHDRISGKYVTLRWEKIYFDALDFSDGAQNLGCLATGRARARKKNCDKKYFLILENIDFENFIILEKIFLEFFKNLFLIEIFENQKISF